MSPAIPSSCCPRLDGKVALVTGGASGIGESIVRLFRRHGARVCVFDLQDGPGQDLCASLSDGGVDHVFFFHGDVTVEDDVRRAVDATVARFGGALDVMVCNAGITGRTAPDIRDCDVGDFKQVLDVNVTGIFLCMKHAARAMIPSKKGSIVSIASVASVLGGLGHGYTSSKHAVVGLTKSAAEEMGRHGVRVNCVSPYAVPTPMAVAYLRPEERTAEAMQAFVDYFGSCANLKGVKLTPGDVAEAVLFLAGEESRYVSGLNLTVDGGYTCVNHDLRAFFGPRPGQE